MANHQHALVRYVTLDRCFSKLRLTKDELLDRCSEAVNRVTGDERLLSEKTFYNDIRAMREGIVMGREAHITCEQGRYRYSTHGFSLFHAGEEKEEYEAIRHELVRMQNRARLAWERIKKAGVDSTIADEVRLLLLGDDLYPWVHVVENQQRIESAEAQRVAAALVAEAPSAHYLLDPGDPGAVQQIDWNRPRFSRAPQQRKPPHGLSPEQFARWHLLDIDSWTAPAKLDWRARWRERLIGRKLLSVLRKMGLQ